MSQPQPIQFQHSQSLVRQQANSLRAKLLQKREKKQKQYTSLIQSQLISSYQQKFNQFKQQIQQYCLSQRSSLDLIKEFRLGQIIEFQCKIQESIRRLEIQQKELNMKKEKVEKNMENVVEILRKQRDQEIIKRKIQMEKEMERLVKEYQERVEIQ